MTGFQMISQHYSDCFRMMISHWGKIFRRVLNRMIFAQKMNGMAVY
jgi:hypothetical protein